MSRSTVKFAALLMAAVISVCSALAPAVWAAGPETAAAASEIAGADFSEEDESSFDGRVAGVITAAVVLCGVVIIVVNGRSKRK